MSSTSQTVGLDSRKGFSFWPTRILGPPPGTVAVNVFCWAVYVIFLLIPLCVYVGIQTKHGAMSVAKLHSDFVYFYGDGKIAREYPSARIYDYDLQLQVFNAIYPAQGGVYGPSPYPPYVPLFFEPFAQLSFQSAYVVWLVISFAIYIIGIIAAGKAVYPGERAKVSLVLCLSLAFFPFLLGDLLNGQLASIGVCAVGLAIYLLEQGSPICSGLALALLAYKPTLVLLLIPMLLLTGRFRILIGFLTGVASMTLVTTACFGFRVWPAYAQMLRYFSRASGVTHQSHLQLWKYLDLKSCFAAVHAGRSSLGFSILIATIFPSAILLAVLLWRSRGCDRSAHWLAWAATLTWTLLINVYVPIYDSVLVVIAIVLTLGALRDLGQHVAEELVTVLGVVLLFVSWKTESFAKAHGIQLLTIGLLILGAAQLVFLNRAIRQGFR
jgi:Glycosyltransferase family 87